MDLDNLRRKIDEIDDKIIILLRERLKTAKKIGKIKIRRKMKIFDAKREKRVLENAIQKAKRRNIRNLKEIKRIYKKIIKMCREAQLTL